MNVTPAPFAWRIEDAPLHVRPAPKSAKRKPTPYERQFLFMLGPDGHGYWNAAPGDRWHGACLSTAEAGWTALNSHAARIPGHPPQYRLSEAGQLLCRRLWPRGRASRKPGDVR